MNNIQRATDSGLLILRVALGGAMLAHGLFDAGVLSNQAGGISAHVDRFANIGLPAWVAYFTLAAELLGGIGLILGLLGRLCALAIAVAWAIVIAKVNWQNGFWNTNGGLEMPLAYTSMALCLLFAGMGGNSVDAMMARGMDKTIASKS
jgi:putative oxidoreductase